MIAAALSVMWDMSRPNPKRILKNAKNTPNRYFYWFEAVSYCFDACVLAFDIYFYGTIPTPSPARLPGMDKYLQESLDCNRRDEL